jgi:nucleoside phosphorylase
MAMLTKLIDLHKSCSGCQTPGMTLSTLELAIVRVLRRSATPLSGRQVADVAGVAPNTALKALKALQLSGLVDSRREGRAALWTTTAEVSQLPELEGATQARVVLVVTAAELEHTEVRNRLVNSERERVGDIWMVRGEVPGDDINWTVYLARAGMGNATSAALVGLAARDLDANLVAFVGTAAGLKPSDQRHLDVVVASRIHNPYVGKQVATESGSQLLGRDRTYVVPAPLVAVVNACIADSGWTSSTRSQHYNAKHPHAFVAPIVSVEAVQGDAHGPVLFEILNRFQDSAALDMESFGLAAGADIHDLPVLAVRGISDFISDKSAAGNDDQQPTAAGNAAALLRDILVFGHPDDFKRGPQAVTPASRSSNSSDRTPVPLPGAFQIWMDRLEQSAPARANAARQAIAEMRAVGVTAATWLNRALHRPPAWLREDDTGDGWALITSLASFAGSTVTWRGFERAAAAAKLTGDLDASSYFTFTSRLEYIGKDSEGEAAKESDEPNPSAMDGFDDDVVARFGSIIEFYRAVLEKDLAKTKARAEHALATLGLTDPFGVLRVPSDPVAVVNLDPELRDLVAAAVLRQLARMMLAPGAADDLGVKSGLAARKQRGNPVTRDLADDGLRLAQWAFQLRPNSEGTRLTQAQALLAVLVSMTGRTSTDVEDEISKSARVVEADALMVRDVYREWDGASGEALAVASDALGAAGRVGVPEGGPAPRSRPSRSVHRQGRRQERARPRARQEDS